MGRSNYMLLLQSVIQREGDQGINSTNRVFITRNLNTKKCISPLFIFEEETIIGISIYSHLVKNTQESLRLVIGV